MRIDPAHIDFVCLNAPGELDCRLLFLGSNYGLVRRAFDEAAGHLEREGDPAELQRRLCSSTTIRECYEISNGNRRVSLRLRDSIFREQGPAGELEFAIRTSVGGRCITHSVPRERFAALGTLAPLLLDDRSERDLRDLVTERLTADEAAWAHELLDWFKSNGCLLSPRSDKRAQPAAETVPNVMLVSHSSLLFKSRRSAVLTDPIISRRLGSPPAAFDVLSAPLGAVCCSHSHWDHCNLQTLMWLDKKVPILIPGVLRPSAFNPPIAPVLRSLGFADIREVKLWEPVQIDDIEIVPVPFHGEEDEPGAEIDHYTYVLRTPGLTVYGGVDCFRDSAGDMKPALERVAREYRPDVAFLPVSKMIYRYRFGGVNSFCRRIDRSLIDRSFQYTAGPEDAAAWARLLGARVFAPYATFLFSPWSASPQAAKFRRTMRSCGLDDRVIPLKPLDTITAADLTRSPRARLHRRWLIARSIAADWLGLARRARRALRRISSRPSARLINEASR